MRRPLRALALCCLFWVLAPRSVAAEWHFTPMVGATFFGSTNLPDLELGTDNVHRNVGGSVSLLGGGLLGVEGLGVWTPGFFDDDFDDDNDPRQLVTSSHAFALMGNVVLTAPRRWTEYSLRPFVSGGVGWMRASTVERFRVLKVNHNVVGFNVGGGAVGFFTQRTGVRFDLRYYSNLNPTDEGPALGTNVRISYMSASVGLVLRRFN